MVSQPLKPCACVKQSRLPLISPLIAERWGLILEAFTVVRVGERPSPAGTAPGARFSRGEVTFNTQVYFTFVITDTRSTTAAPTPTPREVEAVLDRWTELLQEDGVSWEVSGQLGLEFESQDDWCTYSDGQVRCQSGFRVIDGSDPVEWLDIRFALDIQGDGGSWTVRVECDLPPSAEAPRIPTGIPVYPPRDMAIE